MISAMRFRLAPALSIVLSLTLAACSPALVTQAPRTVTPTSTATPAPSPTPSLFTVISGLSAVPSEDDDGLAVIGLVTNRSNFATGEIWVRVQIEDPAGAEIAEQEVSLALRRLAPGETSPFSAEFPGAPGASIPHVEITRYAPAVFERPEADVTNISTMPTVDGRLAVVGDVANRSAEPLEVNGLVVVASDLGGASLALALASAHRTRLGPGEDGPFLALLPLGLEYASFTTYLDATVVSPGSPSRLGFPSPPAVLQDEQGDPFVLGVIRNGDSRPRWVSVLVSLQSGEAVVGVAQTVVPVPLGPGESRPFTITDFPGFVPAAAPGTDDEALTVQAWVDSFTPAEAGLAVVPLDLQMTSTEVIAGTLFLRGTVENNSAMAVRSPAVLSALRSTDGSPLTAGWKVVAESLDPGESASFVLELTLPRGADPVMAEYDVVASGLAPAG
jgi:hypothetical protein